MKIETWVDISQSVEVDISIDDIRGVLAQNFEASLSIYNTVAIVLRAISAEAIAEMSAAQRATIAVFLHEQARRYVPDASGWGV